MVAGAFVGHGWRDAAPGELGNGPSTATVTSLSPTTGTVNTPVTVTITGTGFTSSTVVQAVGGSALPTVFVNATTLRVDNFTPVTEGVYHVGVAKPGELLSNTRDFTVAPSQPASTATVTSLSPISVKAGNMVSVIIDGTGFNANTTIEVVGKGEIPVLDHVSSTQMMTNYMFPSTPGVYEVGVRNPGERLSNTKPFTVTP